jgi:hypothetical protein
MLASSRVEISSRSVIKKKIDPSSIVKSEFVETGYVPSTSMAPGVYSTEEGTEFKVFDPTDIFRLPTDKPKDYTTGPIFEFVDPEKTPVHSKKPLPDSFISYDSTLLKTTIPAELKAIDKKFVELFRPIKEYNQTYIQFYKKKIKSTLKKITSKEPSVQTGKVFVNGLSPRTNEKDLDDLFSVIGKVISTKVLFNTDGTSRCCGYVQFEKMDMVQDAIRRLNNVEVDLDNDKNYWKLKVSNYPTSTEQNIILKDFLSEFENEFTINSVNHIPIAWTKFINIFNQIYKIKNLNFGEFNYDLDQFNTTKEPKSELYLHDFIDVFSTLLLMENLFICWLDSLNSNIEKTLNNIYNRESDDIQPESLSNLIAIMDRYVHSNTILLLIKTKIDTMILYNAIDYIFERSQLAEYFTEEEKYYASKSADSKKISKKTFTTSDLSQMEKIRNFNKTLLDKSTSSPIPKIFKPKSLDGTYLFDLIKNRHRAISKNSPLLKPNYKDTAISKIQEKFSSMTSLKDFTGFLSVYLNSLNNFTIEYAYSEIYCLLQIRSNPHYENKLIIQNRNTIKDNLNMYCNLIYTIPSITYNTFLKAILKMMYPEEKDDEVVLQKSVFDCYNKTKKWQYQMSIYEKQEREQDQIAMYILDELSKPKPNKVLIEKKINRYNEINAYNLKTFGKFNTYSKPPIFIHESFKVMYFLQIIEKNICRI